jgi:tRNA(fMet)-specific endonuclease VapC
LTYVLDTNTVSFLMRGDPGVVARLKRSDRTEVGLPQPVVAEIEYGLARLPYSAQRRRLAGHWGSLREALLRAEWSDDVSRSFGRLKADLEKRGVRIEDFDVAVAAHAVALEAVLVTDNLEHMRRIAGLRTENWRSTPG